MKKTNTRTLVATGLMVAVTLAIGLTVGFIPIGIGPFQITLMCIPVIVGTMVLGFWPGMLLGLTFALTSAYHAMFAPTGLAIGLQAFPGVLYTTIFLPRLIMPLIVYGVDKLTARLKPALNTGITAAAGSLANTVLFLGLAWAIGAGPIADFIGTTPLGVGLVFGTVALTNGVPEMIVAIVLCIPIVGALRKITTARK